MIDYELELFDRINAIKDTITKYGEENFYLSFSGGKDSTVLHYLLDIALPNNNIPRVFINTGIEYIYISICKKIERKRQKVRDNSTHATNQTNSRKVWLSIQEQGSFVKN